MKLFLRIINITLCCGIICVVPDDYEYSIGVGIVALFYSLLTIFQVRGNKNLVILFSIIFYINLSAYILGPLIGGALFAPYQHDLWVSKYDTIGMKSILVSSVVFFLVFNSKKREKNIDNNFYITYNPFLCISCLIAVLLICTFTFSGSSEDGEYISNSNPLYEYVIFIMVLAWYYGGGKPYTTFMWIICATYYVLLGVISGDRSSSFMLLTLIVLYKLHDISIAKILVLCFLGILAANSIALFRIGAFSSPAVLMTQGLKSFFSDTAAHSYYTSITIYYYLDRVGGGIIIFFGWILTIFTGSLFLDRTTVELSALAAEIESNGGGGLLQPSFFAFYGYIGVALGTLIVCFFISKVFYTWNNVFSVMLRYVIPVMSFRWYLYSPTTFFRACLINFGIIYLFTKLLNDTSIAKKRKFDCTK